MTGSNGDERPEQQTEELVRLRAENEELRSSLDRRVRWRGVLSIILVILTSVTLVAAAVSVWARRVAFDTDKFMETVGPVLDDPDFYNLIADRVSDPVIEALAVQTRLAEALGDLDTYLSESLLDALDLGDRARELLGRLDRPELQDLAPPIAAAINQRIDAGLHAFFTSDAFTSRFPGLVRRAHVAAVAVALDAAEEHPNVYVEGGEVRVNLIPLIGDALRQLGDEVRSVLPDFQLPDVISGAIDVGRQQLESAIEARLPDDFGQVTLMSEARLDEIRTAVKTIDRYVWIAVILTVVLLVLALVVSPNRRRTTIQLGIGVFVAVVVAAVAVRRLQDAVVEEILDPRGSAFASSMFHQLFSSLRTLQIIFAVAAILVAIVAYVGGRPDWVGRLSASTGAMLDRDAGDSRLDVWIAGHRGILIAVGILVATGALFLTGLDLISLIVIGVLLVAYLWVIYVSSDRVIDRERESTIDV